MSIWTLAKLKRRFDAKDMTLEEAAYIAGELLQEIAELEGKLGAAREELEEAQGWFEGELDEARAGQQQAEKDLKAAQANKVEQDAKDEPERIRYRGRIRELEDQCKRLEAQLKTERAEFDRLDGLSEAQDKTIAALSAKLETARELVLKACTIPYHPGSPVKYGEFDDTDPVGNYILPKELPNIPLLEADLKVAQEELEGVKAAQEEAVDICVANATERLQAQLESEEKCAMESGGILSDVCDLVFNDPERAAVHGYEGVKERVVDLKNQLRLYQIQVEKYCGLCSKTEASVCGACPLGKL